MKKLLSLTVIAGAMFASIGCEEAKKPSTGGTSPKPADMKKDATPAKADEAKK